jgi:hypothetical protein
MAIITVKSVAGVNIPDSKIAKRATELLLDVGTEFLYNHSLRAFLFASMNGTRNNRKYDAELLYVASVFHDLGLVPRYSSRDLRFEVDGANASRDFLRSEGLPKEAVQLVWDAIALHTTVGIAEHKETEVALLNYGVALDVIGKGYENIDPNIREEIISAFPRTDFKKKIIPTFFSGFAHKTGTTYGTINADICSFMIPHFHQKNFCDLILQSPWNE